MSAGPDLVHESAPTPRETPWARHLHHTHRDNDLARHTLRPVQVFAQSLAAAGPSIAVAGTLPLAYFAAGAGSLASVAIGTGIVLLVAVVVAQFARQHASTGSLATYAATGLGPWAGFASGWGLAIGYTGIASACAAGSALFADNALEALGVHLPAGPVLVVFLVLANVLALAVTVRGVTLSTTIAIALEVVSLLAIAAVLVTAVRTLGVHIDTAAAAATAAPSLPNIASGAVIAVTIFVGFESAGSLGVEARNPHRAIPRAIYLTAGAVGVIYLLAAFVQAVAFSNGVDPTAAITPFSAIAERTSGTALSAVLGLTIAASSFACTIASATAAARILYNLSREGALPAVLGRAHPAYKTPYAATVAVQIVSLLAPLAFVVFHLDAKAGDDVAGQLWASFLATAVGGTYGYLLAYVLVNVSALVAFGRARTLRAGVAAAAILSTLAIAVVGYNVFGGYERSLPIGFAVLLAVGLAWFGYLTRTRPEAAQRVGTFTLTADPLSGRGATASATAPTGELS